MFAAFEIALTFIVIAIWYTVSVKRIRREWALFTWSSSADCLGLQRRSFGSRKRQALSGKHGACTVEAEETLQGGATIRVRTAGLPEDLTLKPEPNLATVKKAFTGEDILLNDRYFDERVNVAGPEEIAVAALSDHARMQLRRLFQVHPSARVACGQVELEIERIAKADELVEAVFVATSVAEALSIDSVTKSLARNAQYDSVAGTRLRNLQVLLDHHPSSDEAKQALEAAQRDPADEIRLEAARHLEPARALPLLAVLATDISVPGSVRVGALDRLAKAHAWSAVAQAIEAASRRPSALGFLVEVAKAFPPEVGAAAVACLGASGDAGLELEEVALELGANGHEDVRLAALAVLGKVGTIRSIEPLLTLEASGLESTEVNQAAKESIRLIQERLGTAGAGQLSVVAADDEAAGLSVVEEPGALSIAGPEDSPAPPSPAQNDPVKY